jgi:hypothetical protein
MKLSDGGKARQLIDALRELRFEFGNVLSGVGTDEPSAYVRAIES